MSDYLLEPIPGHGGNILELATLAHVTFSPEDAALLELLVNTPINPYPAPETDTVNVREHYSGGVLGDFLVSTYTRGAFRGRSVPIHPASLFTLIARMKQEHWSRLTYRSLISLFLLAHPETGETYCVYISTPKEKWNECVRQGRLVKTSEWIPRACYVWGYEDGAHCEPYRYHISDGLYEEYTKPPQ